MTYPDPATLGEQCVIEKVVQPEEVALSQATEETSADLTAEQKVEGDEIVD